MCLALCLSPFSVLRCSRRFLACTSGSTAESTAIPFLRRPSIAFYACNVGILPIDSSLHHSPLSASLQLIMKAVLFRAGCHIHIQLNRSKLQPLRYFAQYDEPAFPHRQQSCAKCGSFIPLALHGAVIRNAVHAQGSPEYCGDLHADPGYIGNFTVQGQERI